jgi:hypothetical protein
MRTGARRAGRAANPWNTYASGQIVAQTTGAAFPPRPITRLSHSRIVGWAAGLRRGEEPRGRSAVGRASADLNRQGVEHRREPLTVFTAFQQSAGGDRVAGQG